MKYDVTLLRRSMHCGQDEKILNSGDGAYISRLALAASTQNCVEYRVFAARAHDTLQPMWAANTEHSLNPPFLAAHK